MSARNADTLLAKILGERMQTRVKVSRLLEILEENRRKHHDVYLEAMKGYRKAAITELETMIADAQAGRRIRRTIDLIQPVNQTSDYDRAIYMLKLTEDQDIVLDENQFRCYVQDKWHWAKTFATSNKAYAVSAGATQYINHLEGQEEGEGE